MPLGLESLGLDEAQLFRYYCAQRQIEALALGAFGGEEIIYPLGVLSGSVSGSIKRGGEVLSSYGLALTRVAVAVLRSGGGKPEPDSSTSSS